MMTMKQTITVKRNTGHWEGNDWIKDNPDPIPVRCSVQPVPGETIDSGEEGRRKKSVISINAKQRLFAASSAQNADLVTWEGEQYEVMSVKPWGTGTRLAHYKATAESVKDHTDADL